MGFEGRRIVENRKERQKGRVILKKSDKKEEITSTDFPEGGNTNCTNRTPGIPTRELPLSQNSIRILGTLTSSLRQFLWIFIIT